MNQIHHFFIKRRYETLLVSLLILLFGQLIVPDDSIINWQSVFSIQNVIAGLLLFSDQKKWRWILIALSIVIITSEVVSNLFDLRIFGYLSGGFYIVFFFLISAKVYLSIFKARQVTTEVIAAVFSGFIMLGIVSSMFFMIIEIGTPESFSNLGSGLNKIQNLQYFGFITTLTIGYGDIVPLTITAKKVTMLMGLIGNFYTVFVMGIIIGKYLKTKD